MIQQVITAAIDGRQLFDLQDWLQNWPFYVSLAVGVLIVRVVLAYYGRRWGGRWEKQLESDREYFRSSRIGPN
jgi:membrane protein implicated in regulation of membrane protease activity